MYIIKHPVISFFIGLGMLYFIAYFSIYFMHSLIGPTLVLELFPPYLVFGGLAAIIISIHNKKQKKVIARQKTTIKRGTKNSSRRSPNTSKKRTKGQERLKEDDYDDGL